jgi:hypothetical protein
VLQELYGLRFTVTVHWVHGKLKLTQGVNDKKGNGRAEFSFTPNSQTGPITFVLDIHHFERPQEPTQMNNHPLADADYNTAFYGKTKDGSLAFGGQCAESPSSHHD